MPKLNDIMGEVRVEETGKRYPFFLRQPSLRSVVDDRVICGDSEAKEYKLTAELGVFFRCTDEYKVEATNRAYLSLYHYLYREQLSLLHDLIESVYGGDVHEIISIADKLEKSMGGHV